MPLDDSRNHFVGPKPIWKRQEFFGREGEIEHLTHLLLAERIVLMYSPSGAGKSSLIQAGVLSEFQNATNGEFEILPTVRFSLNAASTISSESPFSEAAVRCWISSDEVRKSSSGSGAITAFVKHYKEIREKERHGREVFVLLVFDQFEECLTLLPDTKGPKTALFTDLSATLSDENIWALFAIREDLLGPIVDLARTLPTQFRQTFRLDLLRTETATKVIEKTLALGKYSSNNDDIKDLVDDLALVNVQDVDGKFRQRTGEYVEPLYLQVVCKYVLQQLPVGTTEIARQQWRATAAEGIADTATVKELKADRILARTEQGRGSVSRVDEALAAYYRSELSRIANGNTEEEKRLRFWIEEELIDSNRTRIPVRQGSEGTEETEGLDNAQIDMLYEAYLVRKERRLNAFWYELAHDRLVQPILLDNTGWFKAKLGPIAQRYRQWMRGGRDNRYLLNAGELRRARNKELKIELCAPNERKFILDSQRSVHKALVRFWCSLTIPLLLGAGSVWVITERKLEAQKNKIEAQKVEHLRQFSALRPLFSQWSPVTMDQNALFLSQMAKQMSQQDAPRDAMLVGNFFSILDSMLHQWRGRVAEAHWNFQLSASGQFSNWSVLSVASSPDGQIAMGDTHGQIRFLRDHLLGSPILVSDKAGNIETLAYSPDGSRLAVGTERSFVWLFSASEVDPRWKKIQLRSPFGPYDNLPIVHSCSWSSKGDLAVGCQDGKIYIWPALGSTIETADERSPIVVENRLNNQLVPVLAIAWDPTAEMLAIGDSIGNLRILNHDTLYDSQDPDAKHNDGISSVAWSHGGRVACGSLDHSISIWKIDGVGRSIVPTRTSIKKHAHDQWIRDLAWIDENLLASIGDDSALRFWKDIDLKEAGRELTPTPKMNKMSYNSLLKMIVTADDDGAIRMYNIAPRSTEKFGDHESAIICLAATDSHLLSFDSQGIAADLDIRTKREESSKFRSNEDTSIHSVRFDVSLNVFVVGSSSSDNHGRVSVFRPPTEIAKYDCGEPISIVSCHPIEPLVAFLTNKGTLGLRGLPDLQTIDGQQDFNILSAAQFRPIRAEWSKDGKALLVALNDKAESKSEIRIFQFDGRKLSDPHHVLLIEEPQVIINQIAWHPSGTLIALGTTEGEILLHSIAEKSSEFQIGSHVGRVTVLGWASDGRRLLSAGDDRSIKIWNYERSRGLTLITSMQSDEAVYAIAFTPDGRGFYAGGSAPQIAYFPEERYSQSAVLALVKNIVDRNMFPAEWARFSLSDELGSGPYKPTFEDLPNLSNQDHSAR